MDRRTTSKRGLGNPAAVAASRAAGPGAVIVAEAGIQLIPFLVKTGIVCGLAYWGYNKFMNRFENARFNPNYPSANVSDAQAQAKADAIYEAMYGPNADVDAVAAQLAGLNYNGWIKVYNAFGNRESAIMFGSEMNLVEWIYDQFKGADLMKLKFVLNVF